MKVKRSLLIFLAFACLVALLTSLEIKEAKATTITVTRVFSSLNYDGEIMYGGEIPPFSYSAIHDKTWGAVTDNSQEMRIGQARYGEIPYEIDVFRGFVFFSTSILPDNANITSAILSLYISNDDSIADFDLTIQHDSPHMPLETEDYYHLYYSGNGGSRSTSEIGGIGYWNITFSAIGLGWLQKTGITKLCLRSSNDINSNAPSGFEYIQIYSREQDEAHAPKLYVTYQCGSYGYILHGPLLETGLAYNGLIDVTISYSADPPETYTLNGTSGTAETLILNSTSSATIMQWNITTDYSHSRIYVFDQTKNYDEIWLYVPAQTDIVAQYTINVIDFAGLTNAMAETDRNVLGYNRIIERETLDISNPMLFWLIMYQEYTFKIVSTQGTFTWSLPADTSTSLTKTFTVTRDMITQLNMTLNVNAKATRLNSTAANLFYNDPDHSTVWINSIIYFHNRTGYHVVYSQNDSGYYQNYTLNSLSPIADYIATITSYRDGTVLTWNFYLQTTGAPTNPLTGLFDAFTPEASMRILLENSIGMFIVLTFVALGSWSDTEWFLGAAIIIAGVLVYMTNAEGMHYSLLNIPYVGLIVALMVVVFMYIHRGKQETREF